MNHNLSFLLNAEKPTITLGEHVFVVNDEKTNVILMFKGMETKTGVEASEYAVECLLGKDAKETIEGMKLSVQAWLEIFYTLVACVTGEEVEVVKERFQKQ